MAELVLLDNTVLTNFALVNRADLVLRLWPRTACTTSATQAEYQVGAAAGLVPAAAWAGLQTVDLSSPEAALAAALVMNRGREWQPRQHGGSRSTTVVA